MYDHHEKTARSPTTASTGDEPRQCMLPVEDRRQRRWRSLPIWWNQAPTACPVAISVEGHELARRTLDTRARHVLLALLEFYGLADSPIDVSNAQRVVNVYRRMDISVPKVSLSVGQWLSMRYALLAFFNEVEPDAWIPRREFFHFCVVVSDPPSVEMQISPSLDPFADVKAVWG